MCAPPGVWGFLAQMRAQRVQGSRYWTPEVGHRWKQKGLFTRGSGRPPLKPMVGFIEPPWFVVQDCHPIRQPIHIVVIAPNSWGEVPFSRFHFTFP